MRWVDRWNLHEKLIEAAIEHAPNATDRGYFEATRALAEQRLALAEELLRAYLVERPNDARAVTEYAELLISRGKAAAGLDAPVG